MVVGSYPKVTLLLVSCAVFLRVVLWQTSCDKNLFFYFTPVAECNLLLYFRQVCWIFSASVLAVGIFTELQKPLSEFIPLASILLVIIYLSFNTLPWGQIAEWCCVGFSSYETSMFLMKNLIWRESVSTSS